MTRQGTIEAATHGWVDASLLAQQLDRRLVLAVSLWKAARVRLTTTLSVDESLHNLGTFDFVASHLFSASERHSSAIRRSGSLLPN